MKTYYNEVVECILQGDIVKATKFVSPKEIVRATRTKTSFSRGQNIEMTLTIGKPNYAEREFIKDCQKAGEPFPVRNIQVKEYNPKKTKLKRNH